MIEKIRDLMRINEEVLALSKKFDDSSGTVAKFSEELICLKKSIDNLKNSQNSLVEQLMDDSKSIKEIKEEFRKEISDFKLVKSRLEQKLIEKFEEEIKRDIPPRFDRLEKHVRDFEELSKKVGLIANRIVTLSNEIEKFSEISKNIKKEDFELSKFVYQVKAMDNEKLSLLRKIDTLERLISRMRRNNVR